MVGKAASGCLALILLGCAAADRTSAEDLCAALTIPPDLNLACTASETVPDAVEVTPTEGAFAALSRLGLRPLERAGEDALAWTDPAVWLKRQVTLEGSGRDEDMGDMAEDPDSPFAGPSAQAALQSLENLLTGVARLPLNACKAPVETGLGRWSLDCSFTAGGIGLYVQHRLIASGDRRWALSMRAANEQRLRHFEAIANSFTPPGATRL